MQCLLRDDYATCAKMEKGNGENFCCDNVSDCLYAKKGCFESVGNLATHLFGFDPDCKVKFLTCEGEELTISSVDEEEPLSIVIRLN